MSRSIALYGRTGAGKTEIANYLCARYGYLRCTTGSAVREISRKLFATEAKTILNQITDCMRGIDPSVWIRAAVEGCETTESVVFDSMRYPNDYEYLKERGFLAWHIIAPLDVRSTRLAVRGQLYDLDVDETHTSESALDGHKFDAVIENSGGLVDLHRYVDAALLQVLTDRAR